MSNKLQLTPLLAEDLETKLMNGKTLSSICQAKDMPSLSTVYKWIKEDKEFSNRISSARKIGCQYYLDKMIDELETVSAKDVGLVREKLHHYRWLASKLLPSLYGDKQEIIQDTKVQITWEQPTTIDAEASVVDAGK